MAIISVVTPPPTKAATGRLTRWIQPSAVVLKKFVFEGNYLIHDDMIEMTLSEEEYDLNEADQIVHIVNFRHGARLPAPDEP